MRINSTFRVEYAELGLIVEKCSRPDLIFISKHGYAIFSSLYDGEYFLILYLYTRYRMGETPKRVQIMAVECYFHNYNLFFKYILCLIMIGHLSVDLFILDFHAGHMAELRKMYIDNNFGAKFFNFMPPLLSKICPNQCSFHKISNDLTVTFSL